MFLLGQGEFEKELMLERAGLLISAFVMYRVCVFGTALRKYFYSALGHNKSD
jgi:hypothetical protein